VAVIVDFRQSIVGQPDNLRRSGAVFGDALEGLDLSPFREQPLLLTGMGASLFSVVPAALALRAAGRAAFAVPATEVLDPGGDRLGRACVGVSQSGGSTETVDAFRRLSIPRLALTNTGSGALAEVADAALPIGSAEDAGISVLTYTASLLAAVMLAARLGAAAVEPGAGSLPGLVAQAIGQFEPATERFAEHLDGVRSLDVVGRGFSLASAGYTALAIREATRVPTAWFDTRQYLHGPIEVAEPGIGAVVFGSGREVRLASDLAGYGVPVLLVTDSAAPDGQGLEVLRMPPVPAASAPIVHAVPAQLLAEAMARRRGISPGEFRHHQEDTKVQPA
jgi:glucosamine--fructose-6-phosphate aminotransferase (isomerizing)